MKIVVVGKENTGKTSIIKRMTKKWKFSDKASSIIFGKGRREPTDGIEMKRWNPPTDKSTTIHLWDFAGQEIFYTTHQFFLNDAALTLLVFDTTKNLEIENKLFFWMNSISSTSPNSRVILIGTFIDKIDKKSKEQTLTEISNKIGEMMKHLPHSIRFVFIS